MKKRMIIMLIALGILFGLIFVAHSVRKAFIHKMISSFQQQAIVISTTKVQETTWHPQLQAVGTLTAVNGVDVSSEVAGMVTAINFKSGQMAKKGDILVQLNDATDQQTLNTNNAQLTLDKLNYDRQEKLLRTSSTAQSDVDQANAKLLQSQSAAATAQVYIDKKKIKAPFSGKVGISQINLGQYLTPGQPIVTLQALDPIFVDFSLPEQYLPKLHVGQPISITVDAFPKKSFSGKIDALNSTVDVNTRSIQVRAIVPNQDLQLYPGIYANVIVELPEQQHVLVIPQTAVAYSLHGDSAYIIEKAETDKNGKPILHAVQRFIVLGERRDNLVVVLKGLKLDDEVVVSGQLKLQPNSIVEVNNSIKLNDSK